MDARRLDDLLMAQVTNRWQKVAMVLSKALSKLERDHPQERLGWPGRDSPHEVFDALHERIDALVEAGALKAAGNIWRPHRSEVRLPNADELKRMATRMDEREVDVILLSLVRHRWQKVLKVVSCALDQLGAESEPKPPWWPSEDEGLGAVYDAITERIEALVETGRLEARGNIWRSDRSEIRRPDRALEQSPVRGPSPDAERADRLAPLSADRLDAALLSLLDHGFKKVAPMVARTVEQLRPPEAGISSEDVDAVLTRMEVLIELGTIEADGDVRHIGYTQIRLRDASDEAERRP